MNYRDLLADLAGCASIAVMTWCAFLLSAAFGG